MPDIGNTIVIEGYFAAGVLGTFRIIRGFASLQELALISAPYPMNTGLGNVRGHQRAVDSDHAGAIKRYLEDGRLRFIPEVILSIRASTRDEVDDLQRVVGIASDEIAGLSLRKRRRAANDAIHQIVVDRDRLPDLLGADPRIRRIDGNHRLHLAAELTNDATSPTKYLAPFCAIVLGPPDDENDNYVESMLFHTINSTALPLDSEHALELVLRQTQENRPSPEEEFAMSPSLHLTRLMRERLEGMPKPQRDRLGATPATVLHSAARAIISSEPTLLQSCQQVQEFAATMWAALTDILARLNPVDPDFCKATYFTELAALAWNDTSEELGHEARVNEAVRTLEQMGRWLGRDGFHRIEARRSLAQQLFEIFRAVRDRVPKRVFLSRWYPTIADGDEHRKGNLRKQMIDRMLEDLRLEGIDLQLDDPGTREGATFPIHEKMYEAIRNDDIILVDLSGVRPNVSIEAGYALERHTANRLLFLFQPTLQTPNNPPFNKPPFDLATFRYEAIDDAAEIPDKLKPHLRTIWGEAMQG